MANSDLHANWFFQSAYSPQELVEVLPTIRTISESPPIMIFDWKKLSLDGFQLHYTFGGMEMQIPGTMTPRDQGTMIAMRRPRFFTLTSLLVVGVCSALAFAMVVWACWPAIERNPWEILVPLVALIIGVILIGGPLGLIFLWGRASLKSVLCHHLKAELLDPNIVRQF